MHMNFDIEKMLAEQTPEEVLAAVQEEITRVTKEKDNAIAQKRAIIEAREELKGSMFHYMSTVLGPDPKLADYIDNMDKDFEKIERIAARIAKMEKNDEKDDILMNFVRGLF